MDKKRETLKNLKKVLEKLPRLAEEHPEIKEEFDMLIYGVYHMMNSREAKNSCRTCGCLAGNIARLFPLKPDYFSVHGLYSYDLFLHDVFPYFYDKFTPKIHL